MNRIAANGPVTNFLFRLAGALLLTATASCRSQESAVADLAGCYSIATGEFSPALTEAARQPPTIVRLDTTRKDFLLHPQLEHRSIPNIVGGGDFFFSRDAAWRVDGDTLVLVWASAFTGVEIRVSATGSPLRGEIEFFSDQLGRQEARASISLVRGPCTRLY
jgi:hypothetical protein